MPGNGGSGGLKRIGGFELLSLLGRGGMGAVYKARQSSLDRLVALKVLPPSLARNSDFIARFLREARAAGRLNHPNIVSGIDVGEADGFYYFAMEFVDGESLGARLAREGTLPPADAIGLVRQVVEGLGHAHEHGLIHRDVKPDNVLVDRRGVAKLCDLGLARGADGDDSSLTQTGTALGTPNYISPEQARGDGTVDGRTDIYSLGASLFHLVAGRPPFQGKTSALVLSKHLTEAAPALSSVAPEAGSGLSAVVAKCMEKDPAKRYQSMAELAEDLDRLATGRAPAAARATRVSVRRGTHATTALAPVTGRRQAVGRAKSATAPGPVIAAVAAILVAAGIGVWVLANRGGPAPPEPPPDKPVTRPNLPERPPERPADPTAELARQFGDAEAYWAGHPADFDGAWARFRKVWTAAGISEYRLKAQQRMDEIAAARSERARSVRADLSKRSAELAGRGDYDGALGLWAQLPAGLASELRPAADAETASLRGDAETRLKAALQAADARLAAGKPDEGLRELDAVAAMKYAAGKDRLADARQRLDEARGSAEALERQKALAAARGIMDGLLTDFDTAASGGDIAGAVGLAGKAAGDARLDPLTAERSALSQLGKALERADKARAAALAALRDGEQHTIATATAQLTGKVVEIGPAGIVLEVTYRLNGEERTRRQTIPLANLTLQARRELRGDFAPRTSAEHLAAAILALGDGDLTAAGTELSAGKGHALAGRWQARLDERLMGRADAEAKRAWDELAASPAAAPAAKLDEKSAGRLLELLDAYSKAHGATKFAASIAGRLEELRARARSATGTWVSVPAAALQVLVKGGASCTADETGQSIRITVPKDAKALIPLLANSADFGLKFQYRGPGIEMFLRRDGGKWQGCFLSLLTAGATKIRYYPVEDGGRGAQEITVAAEGLNAGTWHSVEVAARGRSFLMKVDGRVVAQQSDLPAVTRGDGHIMVWDTGGAALEFRGLEISVAEKDTATHAEGGIIGGIVTARDREATWVEVEADGGGGTQRYVPFPMAGGINPMTAEALKKVFSANRVTLIWKPLNGERRIAAIWVHLPSANAGTVDGTVVRVLSLADGRWMQFDLKPDGGAPVERYSPTYRNGPDPEITTAIRALREGQRVRVEWHYDSRKRALKIQQLQ